MTTYLYGLLLADSARVAREHGAARGVGDAEVRVLDCGGLAALVSTVQDKVTPTLDAVRAHDGVLQQYVDDGSTVAAVRFGQQFDSDADCREHVAARAARVAELLRRFDGSVEMRVLLPLHQAAALSPEDTVDAVDRVSPGAATDRSAPGAGRAYLEALRAQNHVVTGVRLTDAIGPIVRAEKVEELPRSRGYSFAHLIRREDERQYRDALDALPALAEAKVVGPLALYSFAEPAT